MGLIEEPGKIINGEIFFEGKDLIKLSEHEKRKIRGDAISMIFQDPMTCLNPVYTIGNQLTEALTTHQKISKTEAINRIIELLNLVGINEPKRTMCSRISRLRSILSDISNKKTILSETVRGCGVCIDQDSQV